MTSVPPTQPPAAPETDVRLSEAEWDDLRSENMHDLEDSVRRWIDNLVAERVRVVEGERDAARAERDEMSGWIEEHALVKTLARIAEWQEATGAELPAMARAAMHAYAARAESAEAAHRALQAAVEALADEWAAIPDDRRYDGDRARALRALLTGGAR